MILTTLPGGLLHGHGTADATPPSPRAFHFAPATESMCAPGYLNASRQPLSVARLIIVISPVKPDGQRCRVWYCTSAECSFRRHACAGAAGSFAIAGAAC